MSKRKISGKALSIQFGREETQIVLVGKNAELLYGISVPTPVGAVEDGMIRDEEAVRQMLKEALTTPEFKKVRKVVFSLVTSQVITENAVTPDLPAQRLEKLIQANMDMYFPVDVQDCQVVWQVIGPKVREGGLKELAVQLWAIPNAMLSRYYTVANDCGLSVMAIDYCGNSIANAVGASFAAAAASKERKQFSLNMELSFGKKEKVEPAAEFADSADRAVPDTDLHITMEKELLGMTFVQNGQVVLQRFIQCGPNPVYQVGEIAMMVEYFRGLEFGRGSKIRGILSGALAEETALIAELSDVLDIPLSTFPITYDTRWFLCAGAALTTLDFGIPALNRPGKARREFQSQAWQYGLILAGALAVLAVVMLTMTSRLTWNASINALESEKQVLTIQSAQSAGFADNYYAYQNVYSAYEADWKTIFDSLQTYNDNLVLVMDELEELMPDNSSVVGMQVGATGLNVTFAAETKEEAAYLMMALRDMEYADLMAISSLQGGGAGPATSYGSNKEAAPSEGSSTTRKTWAELTTEEKGQIYQPILDEAADKYVLGYYFGLGKNYADNAVYMDALYELCGISPEENAVINLADYTWEERAAAFEAMFTTNPFAMQTAASLLMGAMEEDLESPLAQYILSESTLGAFDLKFHTSVSDLQDDVEELVDVITWPNPDYDALADTEALLLEDQTLTDWYAYYLAHYQGKDLETTEPPICIKTDPIVLAVVNDPEGTTVNSILYNNCLSAETRALIEEVTAADPEPSIPESSEDPSIPESSEDPSIPESSEDPTESEEELRNELLTETLPGAVATYLKDGSSGLTAYEEGLVKQYLNTTSDAYLEEQVTKYFNDGHTDTAEMDAKIEAYLATLSAAEREALEDKYVTTPPESSEDPSIPESSEDPSTPESSEDPSIPESSEDPSTPESSEDPSTPESSEDPSTPESSEDPSESTPPNESDSKIELVLKYYLPQYILQGKVTLIGEYSQYEQDVNDLLELYFTTGSTETVLQGVDIDATLDAYIGKGSVDSQLTASMAQYLEDPAGLNCSAIKEMLDNYYAGTTYNDTLDTQLDKCKEGLPDYLAAWLATYLSSSSTGSAYGDGIIKDYLSDGKTNSMDNTTALDQSVSAGNVDKQLTTLIQMYTLNKKQLEQYPVLFGLLNNYYTKAERTGSDAMDNRIKDLDKKLLDSFAEQAMNANNGGSEGQQQQEPDTRYFFAVTLMYNDELRSAELERKGLDEDAIVEPLEVEE